MLDYLIVGLGLAGISFCEKLESNNKSFMVISDASQTSSLVAGGMYNPVNLKRFTPAWMAKEQLEIAMPFYGKLEKKLDTKLNYEVPILRRFATIGEQNNWFEATDKASLKHFLSTKLVSNKNLSIDAAFGYGEVLHTGRIDTEMLLSAYGRYLIKKKAIITERFDYDLLDIFEGYVGYKGIRAKQIVFAEGFGLKQNPFFDYLPLNGTKGELLTIKTTELKESNVIKSSVFIIPMGNDLYRVGATYKWKDKSNTPTMASKEELLDKLNTFLRCSYEVIDHVAGIRPTVSDRKPLVGRHPKYPNVYVLNGFGSRGVMTGPFASGQLYDYIEKEVCLHPDMDIARFNKMG